MGCCKSYYCKQELAALEAENERLKKALSEQIDRDISGIFPAERALAERAGGVKVKALEWVKDNSVGGHGGWIGRAGDFTRAVKIGWMVEMPYEFGDQAFATLDDAKAAAQADYERRILSTLTTEPAAPEGRQEAVALTYGQKLIAEAIEHHFGERGHNFDEYDGDATVVDVWNAFDDLTRPSEQAVTEAMVEAAWNDWQTGKQEYGPEAMRSALKAAMEAGR